MAQKPSIPKGTRDFSSLEVSKRNYIMDIMRTSFKNYGYQPIETPSFEKSETLMGKYGEEGDRVLTLSLALLILRKNQPLKARRRPLQLQHYSRKPHVS